MLSALAAQSALLGVETNTWGTALEQLQNGLNLRLWGAVLSTLAAAWWISAIYLRHRGTQVRKVDNASRLYRDLVRVHHLSWAERSLLEQLAEVREAEDPAMMFVRDDYFAVHDLEGEICEQAAAVKKLREKLFGNVEVGVRNSEPKTEEAEPATTT